MLAPDYLDHAPDRLVLLWQQVEDDILRDVARRISKMDTMTPTANWQLWRYEQTEALRQDVVKKLARYTGKSEAEIRRLMQEAGIKVVSIEWLRERARLLTGEPQPIEFTDRVVAVVRYRDGSVIDVVHQVKE